MPNNRIGSVSGIASIGKIGAGTNHTGAIYEWRTTGPPFNYLDRIGRASDASSLYCLCSHCYTSGCQESAKNYCGDDFFHKNSIKLNNKNRYEIIFGTQQH